MSTSVVIGIDIGTTSVKAVAFNKLGHVLGEHEIEYPLHTPYPGWAEQDSLEIERAALTVIHHVVHYNHINPKHILAFGFSTAMHSLICMDEQGQALSPLLTWADGRSAAQAEALRKENGMRLYEQTGTPIHPMSPLVKLVWMKENHYQPYKQATKFVSIKEFLIYRWFGQKFVDYAIASATGLFNINTLAWDQEALYVAGISEDQLFTPVPPTEVLNGLKNEIAQRLGISSMTPFVIGASDGPLANLGIGAIQPREVAITIGTSGAIRQMVTEPQTDQMQQTFCYRFTDDLSLIGGPTNNGAIVLKWIRQLLGHQESYEALLAYAEKAAPGAEGLLFLPYLNGERAPMWNANVRGNLFGLSFRHQKEHLIRAGLEGVIYSIFHVGQALERLAGSPTKIYASGGFARSPLWLQILADTFNQEVHVPISHQSSAWGAAWVALCGIGEVEKLDLIKNHIPMQGTYTPNPDHHDIYQEMFQLYLDQSKKLNEHYSF